MQQHGRVSQHRENKAAAKRIPFIWSTKIAKLIRGIGNYTGQQWPEWGWGVFWDAGSLLLPPLSAAYLGVFSLQKLSKNKQLKKGGKKKGIERKEKGRKEGKKSMPRAHTLCHCAFLRVLLLLILFVPSTSASHLSLILHILSSKENLVCRSFALKEPCGIPSVKKTHRSHKPSTSFISDLAKDTEVTAKRMHFHGPTSKIWRGAQAAWFTAACPTLTDTVFYSPDQLLFLGCLFPQLTGLDLRLCLAFLRVVPVLVTE